VTAAMLDVLERCLDHDDPRDAAVFVTACCAFWGQMRLGEILSVSSSPAQGPVKCGRIPTFSDLSNPSSRDLHLPYMKTKGPKGEDTMLCRQSEPSDP
ncbi:hypothetical protein B0H17DRAFT_876978, partial [Mycena rosella]